MENESNDEIDTIDDIFNKELKRRCHPTDVMTEDRYIEL